MTDPTDPAALARRYRRLLFAYPREYRRGRTEEIVDTMLDAAPPGRRRPTFREAVNLLRHGLRCRLGRPISRWVVPLSLLTALAAGMIGAAGASRLVWQTAGPLPTDQRVHQIFRTAVPEPVHDQDGFRQDYIADIDGYGKVDLTGYHPATMPLPAYATAALDRLRAAGWEVSSPTITWNNACFGGWWGSSCDGDDLHHRLAFTARKDGLVAQLTLDRLRPSGQAGVSGSGKWTPSDQGTEFRFTLDVYRTTPTLALPVAIIAGLVCAFGAWLSFGRISRRTERRARGTRLAVYILYGAVGCGWWMPAVYGCLGSAFFGVNRVVIGLGLFQPNDRWLPNDIAVFCIGPFLVLDLLGALAALALVVLSLLPGPRTDQRRRPVPLR
jgi:hypothetical protein